MLEVNFFSLELVFHQVPVGNATIGGNGVEIEVLSGFLRLPTHLPDGVSVLGSSDGGLVNGLVVLVTDIEDHDSTIVASSSDKSGLVRMEVNSHHT